MKDVTDYIEELRKAAKASRLSREIMIPAIEQLSSPEERRTYFDAYVKLAKEGVQVDVASGVRSYAVNQVNAGTALQDVAIDLALNRFRFLLNDYDSAHFHRVWNRAIPDLKTARGLASLC